MMRKLGVAVLAAVLLFMAIAVPGTAQSAQSVEGYLQEINGSKITVETYNGWNKVLTVKTGAKLTIDQRVVPLNEFKPGMEVYCKLQGQTVTEMEGYATAVPGYLPPSGKMRTGMVTRIDRDQLQISNAVGKATYFTSGATIVRQNGKSVKLSNLRVGDRVKLYFDAFDSDVISRLEIAGSSIEIKNLYKGKLAAINVSQRLITLQSVKVLRNGKWQNLTPSLRLSYPNDRDTRFYSGGKQVTVSNLQYCKGKETYIAVRNYFGRQQIARIVVKGQYETNYTDKIASINWYAQGLELANRKNISFNEGTIILKSGRLVDQSVLQPNDDARILTDGQGSTLTAAVIEVFNEGLNNSNIGQYALYAGKFEEIYPDQIVLRDFAIMNAQSWEAYRDTKELAYDSDTLLYDLEAKRIIGAQEFYTRDYAVPEDEGESWFTYVYTDGDRVIGAAVQQNTDSLLAQRVSTGTIQKIEEDPNVGWVLTLREAKDWSSRKAQWMAKDSTIRIGIDKAMLFKDDSILQPQNLRVGDRLYIVRDDFMAKVVIVK